MGLPSSFPLMTKKSLRLYGGASGSGTDRVSHQGLALSNTSARRSGSDAIYNIIMRVLYISVPHYDVDSGTVSGSRLLARAARQLEIEGATHHATTGEKRRLNLNLGDRSNGDY
jgi:hypothetical protein